MVHTPASDRDVPRQGAVPPADQINPQRGGCHYFSTGQYHNDFYHTQASLDQFIILESSDSYKGKLQIQFKKKYDRSSPLSTNDPEDLSNRGGAKSKSKPERKTNVIHCIALLWFVDIA